MKKKNILITGVAGFIGFHVAKKLLNDKNNNIIGIDSLNKYYSPKLKIARLNILKKKLNFSFKKINIVHYQKLQNLFKKNKFEKVINLAAQAGVRYSLKKPRTYIRSNIIGFFNIIDLSKDYKIKHLIYASSSSVYGANKNLPFPENSPANHPIQLYAATKLSNESMAHAYSSLYKLPTSGIRFFSVYGPWGRPDQALFIFTKKILNNQKLKLFNYGNHTRDFTYIDDLVEGIVKISKKVPQMSNNKNYKKLNQDTSVYPYEIYNLGSGKTVKLKQYLSLIEKFLRKKAKIDYLPLQKGDVINVSCSISKAKKLLGYNPKTQVAKGIFKFVEWYLQFFHKK
jgi:UDP-glucuronate 4-epimerase